MSHQSQRHRQQHQQQQIQLGKHDWKLWAFAALAGVVELVAIWRVFG